MNVSLQRRTSDGDIKDGSKQSKADTPPLRDSKSPCWYLLHVIQNKSGDSTGNSSDETNTKLHENVLLISLPLIKNSISTDSISQKCFSVPKMLSSEGNKSRNQKLCASSSYVCMWHNSLRVWFYKWQSSGFKSPLHEFIMRLNYFCTQRNIRRERWETRIGGEKKNGGGGKK